MAKIIKVGSQNLTPNKIANPFKTSRTSTTNPFKYNNFEGFIKNTLNHFVSPLLNYYDYIITQKMVIVKNIGYLLVFDSAFLSVFRVSL